MVGKALNVSYMAQHQNSEGGMEGERKERLEGRVKSEDLNAGNLLKEYSST